MTRINVLVAAVALVVGFGGGWYAGPGPARRYCKECGAIVALQARPGLTPGDRNEVERLKMNLASTQQSLAIVDRMAGRPPDLHPDCECPCHRYWAGEASRVHDGA